MPSIFKASKKRVSIWIAVLIVVVLSVFIRAGIRVASRPISYLPKNIPDFSDTLLSKKDVYHLKNSQYNIAVDRQGKIIVYGIKGKIIISNLTYYGELKNGQSTWGLKNVVVKAQNDSTIKIQGESFKHDLVDLLIISNSSLSKIDFKITTHYDVNTLIKREALVAAFKIPVSQVYSKNRQVDTNNLSAEYWLQKEGVLFSDQQNSALIYHTPFVSSLQLETNKKLLFINLDYALDHPFAHLPYQEDAGRRWIDVSEADYKKGSERQNSFSIHLGPIKQPIPRLMQVPFGYKAGYVFTEHADGGTIRTQRAAYFGSEDITKASEATGGFVKYKIPVTKSIFYTGPQTFPGASIYEGGKISPLLNFLDQIYTTGNYDLCLHTPDDATSNRKTLEESIKFMKERYNTISWIDHGFYGGKINREASVCDGLDSTSDYYAADLWKKYDTKYFWSPAVEMIKNKNWVSVTENLKKLRFFRAYVTFLRRYASSDDLKQLNFFQLIKKLKTNHSYRYELNTLEYNSGTSIPTPLYWQDSTRTKSFYSWATDQEKVYGELSETEVENEKEQLSDLINHHGIFIDHGYFVRNRSDDRILNTVNGHLKVNPNFNKILSLISDRRAKGDLYVTTIKDLLSYWINLQKVEFQYLQDGSVNVINNNDEAIKGLSFIINAKTILVDGAVPSLKRTNNETIFWFDIEGHQTVNLISH